jgi:polar amino acid transport system substrate-binding protein
MSISKFFLFILSTYFNIFSYADYYQTIKVCSEAGFIPFEMKTTSGKWDGYDIALIRKFAETSGKKLELLDMKFDGLIPALVANKGCDIVASAVGINEERNKVAIFSEATYQSAYAGIVKVSDKNRFYNYEMINKEGVRIAVQQGTQAAEYVKANYTKAIVLLYEDNSTPINAIITNKADIYIDDSVYTSIAVKRNMQNLFFLKPEVFPKNSYDGMGFVFRKSDVKLRDEFNTFFDKIKNNGSLFKLQKYYFEDMVWMKDFSDAKL